MVDEQLRARGIRDARVLQAFTEIPRHIFVPAGLEARAYADMPLPIGDGQTISQPFIVAAMVESLKLEGDERVLEIGTGSGYMTAILARLCNRVYSVERLQKHVQDARYRLEQVLSLSNVILRAGDGSNGWPSEAPFGAILVSAASPIVPPPLVEQLGRGGRLILPLGNEKEQRLTMVQRVENGSTGHEDLGGCRFVKLIGEHGWKT